MARARGISKAQGYLSRVFTVEYDFHGAIQAYGIEFVHWLADEINEGRINCRQDVDRWAAHIALTNDYKFAMHVSNYGDSAGLSSLEEASNQMRKVNNNRVIKPKKRAA